ncbi:MAG TPA: hypothetical protein VM639_01890 [Dongiaceae bacterium]|nr:hypothetical protein [Dongiaceae bacterium]
MRIIRNTELTDVLDLSCSLWFVGLQNKRAAASEGQSQALGLAANCERPDDRDEAKYWEKAHSAIADISKFIPSLSQRPGKKLFPAIVAKVPRAPDFLAVPKELLDFTNTPFDQ